MHVQNLQPDVFAVTETWLHETLPTSLYGIENYNLVRLDRNWSDTYGNCPKKGGGFGVYLKESLNYSTSNLDNFNTSNCDIEVLWLSIKNEKQRDFIIGVIYRPPTGNIRNFCEYLKKTVLEVSSYGNVDVFVIGDFNIDYSNNRAVGTNDLKDLEMSTGLKQLIKEPTRYGNSNTLINLVFTNSDFVFESGVLDINPS